ncbi:helix-turn-helix domain-containing protein [Haloactinomyces albus]|uniref:Transcriptional regulator with XRE-family HTH domain n=1 Tax=Haloactinomyces albus TaxID=1352928 RepID=A0AAE4CL43_9ACTN|nr:helix-turn-helix transcriptional regulator [Haloactinomyces albus]MDR7301870.1 transcriptional regulator with XRE-family HTH domain [Haloactinomyces albus]
MARDLRSLRDKAGLTTQQVADSVGRAQSLVSRWEAGKRTPAHGDVVALAELYEISRQERDQLTSLARDARRKGWWETYVDVLPEWHERYLGLEAEATEVSTYEPEVIPGLLQTQEYARALTKATLLTSTADEVERRVDLRLQRQERLSDDEPLQLWAIAGEAALYKKVGGPEVLAEQLRHLIKAAESPNITFQVMPLEAGAQPATGGQVTILRYAEAEDADVVYLESQHGGFYVEDLTAVANYAHVMEHLRAHAADPAASLEIVRQRIGAL